MDIIGTIYRDGQIPELQYGVADYDDFRSSLLTSFQGITTEGWIFLMQNYEDTSGEAIAIIYYVSYVVILGIVLTNLFIAVLYQNYSEQYDSSSDPNEEKYQEMIGKVKEMNLPLRLKYLFEDKSYSLVSNRSNIILVNELRELKHPIENFQKKNLPESNYYKNALPAFCYKLINYSIFEAFIFLTIMINLIILCFDKYTPSDPKEDPFGANNVINYLFILLFFAEVGINLIGEGSRYFYFPFNIIDIVLVFATLINF